MKNMAKIVSNRRQLTKLVQIMEQNLDVAKGLCSKVASQRKWEEFAVILNGLGPPLREWSKWQRVWTDLKCKTKKKKTASMIETSATGGGPNRPHQFNDTEEAIIKILELNTWADPPGQEIELEDTASETAKAAMEKKAPEKIPRIEKVRDGRMILLEDQTSAQKNFYEIMTNVLNDLKTSMKNIEYYIKKSAQNKDEILKIKREKLKLYKQSKENKDRDRRSKLKLKNEILEMKKQKYKTLN